MGGGEYADSAFYYCVLMGKYIVQHIASRKLDTVNVVVSSQLTANYIQPDNTTQHQQGKHIYHVHVVMYEWKHIYFDWYDGKKESIVKTIESNQQRIPGVHYISINNNKIDQLRKINKT